MQQLSDDDIIQATCAVLVDSKVKGAAWLVSDEGHLLTAGHLLGTEKPRETVEVRFPEDIPLTAHKILWGYQRDMGIDFAVLKLANPPANRYPLPISLARSVTGTFRLCGYGQSLVDLSIGRGEFLGFYDRQNSPANRLFKLDSKQLGQGGYSGGAVVSDELQVVVAVQIAATGNETGAERDTVLAMPLYRIAKHWELLNPRAEQLEKKYHKPKKQASSSGVQIGNVSGGITNSIIAGGDVSDVTIPERKDKKRRAKRKEVAENDDKQNS
jgi:hypothetical protein